MHVSIWRPTRNIHQGIAVEHKGPGRQGLVPISCSMRSSYPGKSGKVKNPYRPVHSGRQHKSCPGAGLASPVWANSSARLLQGPAGDADTAGDDYIAPFLQRLDIQAVDPIKFKCWSNAVSARTKKYAVTVSGLFNHAFQATTPWPDDIIPCREVYRCQKSNANNGENGL